MTKYLVTIMIETEFNKKDLKRDLKDSLTANYDPKQKVSKITIETID